MRSSLRLCIFVLLTQLAGTLSTGLADEPAKPPKTPAGALLLLFADSFYSDVCGDPGHGRIYRQAILEKLAECPLPQSQKNAIAGEMTAYQMEAERFIQHYFLNHGRLPNLPAGFGSCEDLFKLEQTRFEELDAYAAGTLKIDDMWQGACDPMEGGP